MSDDTPKTMITFTVRMPIRADQDPADAAADLLRYGASGVEQGVEIVTEPTDAEIEAAAEAMWNHHEDFADARKWRTRHTPRQQWADVRNHPVGDFFRGDARAALVAARKVGQA